MLKRYAVVGGSYFRSYTGTGTYTALKVLCKTDSFDEAEQIVRDECDECGGLIEIIDMETEVQPTDAEEQV